MWFTVLWVSSCTRLASELLMSSRSGGLSLLYPPCKLVDTVRASRAVTSIVVLRNGRSRSFGLERLLPWVRRLHMPVPINCSIDRAMASKRSNQPLKAHDHHDQC